MESQNCVKPILKNLPLQKKIELYQCLVYNP